MEIIKEDYISFETAKLLKEKGIDYNVEYESYYTLGGKIVYLKDNPQDINIAPRVTLQMAIKWLREAYGLYIEVSLSCDRDDKSTKIFDASIFNIQNQRYKKLSNIQGYEQACETAIKYCLENLI